MKILLIDDEKDILDILKDYILEIFPNSNIFCASSFSEVKANINKVDIILTDINMPDGFEIHQELAAQAKPVGIMSGALTTNVVIGKPFDVKEVRLAIEDLYSQISLNQTNNL